MKIYNQPDISQWSIIMKRPTIDAEQLTQKVKSIMVEVRSNGDRALIKYTSLFDSVDLIDLEVSKQEVDEAIAKVSQELKDAIQMAYNNITVFHKSQQIMEDVIETTPGVKCWRKSIAIEKVGLYIPGGSAPLFSTILMLGIPAQIAGCKEIVLCTPPNKNMEINAAILYTAHLVGITKIFKSGGAQAIAAMAYGTQSIPQVSKIFGPGNQYVTKAKELIQQSGVAIDMPAGPSELLVIADETCLPSFVAADLLSQAEHGPDSQVILVSNNADIINLCIEEVYTQIKSLPRKQIALEALKNSKAVLFESMYDCIAFSNSYAPEHLIIASDKARLYADAIINAGSVFLGNYSCESAGDYASGTNHTLPTNGHAKSYSGVSLDSFVKKITFQELSREGISNIGKAIEIMAETEELKAHKNAVSIRLNKINND